MTALCLFAVLSTPCTTAAKPGFIAAVLLAIGLLFFARPQFAVSLADMNTVSEETLAADSLFTKVWGSVGDKIVLMNKADGIDEIQQDNDRLLAKIEQDIDRDVLQRRFCALDDFSRQREGSTQSATPGKVSGEMARDEQITKALAECRS